MPQNCYVPHCTKKFYRDGGNKISFHKFPRELTDGFEPFGEMLVATSPSTNTQECVLCIERENCCTLTNQLCDAQRQVEELTSRLENCEKRLFSFSRFTSSKSISFYTGFDRVEVFNALYEFLDHGEQSENIRY